MATAVGSILRQATRKPGEVLNVLTCCTHESYESALAKTNAHFYAVRTPQVKDWDQAYRPLPSNYTLLNPQRGMGQIPPDVEFDLVLSQNKFGQYQLLSGLARQLHLPLVTVEHTEAYPTWPEQMREQLRQMRGDIDVFISDYSRKVWGWDDEAVVIEHGIDASLFSPNEKLVKKKGHALSVVNDWINRDYPCGFRFWQEATQGLPVFVVGKTPGFSEPAKSVAELVLRYREAGLFVNTSAFSPIPTSLLEAMSCGLPCVSRPTGMIADIIRHGENGLLAENPQDMRKLIQEVLQNQELAHKLGQNARKTISMRFSMDRFVREWNEVFERAAKLVYKGV